MVRSYLAVGAISLPLLFACGEGKAPKSADGKDSKPKAGEEQNDSNSLFHSILVEALGRNLITYEDYEEYLGERKLPVFDGKERRILTFAELEDSGIKVVADAFKNLEFLEELDLAELGDDIRNLTLDRGIISPSTYAHLRELRMVPFAYGKCDLMYVFEKNLILYWVLEAEDAIRIYDTERCRKNL